MRSNRLNQSPSSGQNASMPALDERHVLLPVVLDVRRVDRFAGPRRDRAVQRRQPVAVPRHHVHDDLHVLRVHVGDHRLRVALEDVRVEVERRLPRVPARGAKPVPR